MHPLCVGPELACEFLCAEQALSKKQALKRGF